MSYLNKIIVLLLLILQVTSLSALPYLSGNNTPETLSPEQLEEKILMLNNLVKAEGRIVEMLSPDNASNLPVGISKTIGGIEFIVIIDEIKFTTSGAVANAYMTFQFPGSDKQISFKAINVSFYPWGFLQARMQLVKEKKIELGNIDIIIKPDGTFVDFDCMGYQQTSLSADIVFPPGIIVKENPVTRNPIPNSKITSSFTAQFTDFNDIMVKISMDPFQINGLNGFGFYTNEVYIDFSDARNPAFGSYTNNYLNSMQLGEDATLWRGVYIKRFEIKLPKEFCKPGSESIGIAAEDMLFDENGITGKILLQNLLPLDKGNIAGWQFSIDGLNVGITAGNFDQFGLNGKIVLPVSETPSPMNYSAVFDNNSNYIFSVTPPESTKFDIWAADVNIYNNSSITVSRVSNKFSIKAQLNGEMTVNPGSVNIADIIFQKLTIQTSEPKFSIESFTVTSGVMKGFPITLTEIGYEKKGNKHGINMGVSVHLKADVENGFNAEGGLTIFGVENPNGGTSSWKFSHVQFNRFAVNIIESAFSFIGSLDIFNEDPVYGNGIKGMVDARFAPVKAGLGAVVQFGNVNGYRYWYCDAFVTLGMPIPIFTGIDILGFGGGAYYHMEQQFGAGVTLPATPNAAIDTSKIAGKALSGIVYVPNKNINLGLKASVLIAAKKTDVFNAKVTLGVEFYETGGINAYLQGDALVMSPIGTPKTQAKMYAGINLQYSTHDSSFCGNLEIYINAGDAIKGIHENGRAGNGQMYFGHGEWYIYLGLPTQRIGVNILNTIQADAYFVTGNSVPGIPAPPADVSSILGDIDLDMCRDLNKLDNGGGFAFGSSLSINTGRKNFMIFYGNFNAGVGFDLMLVNYGDSVQCEGRPGVIGINGWYASGQAYAYMQGNIGMHVNILNLNKDVNILNIGAAVVLQAQLPNPLFMRGTVGGHYSVLGGLVKGNCRFQVEIGEQCVITNANILDGITVISDITPRQGTNEVDVFISPQATFNYQIDKEFELTDIDNSQKKFRIKFDYFKIKQGNNQIDGQYLWNQDTNIVAFESIEILPGTSQLTGEVKVHFEEFKNGVWQPVVYNGQNVQEIKTTNFTTGVAPNYIPVSNISYCYPVVNMLNFYKNEYPTGYIQLKKGQSYLFDYPADQRWESKVKFVNAVNTETNEFVYNKTEKKLTFNIPSTLINEKVYELKFANIPLVANADITDNVEAQETILATGDTLTTKSTDGTVRQFIDEETILTYNIRTSKYNTFGSKLDGLTILYDASSPILEGIHRISKYFSSPELFSNIEINGNSSINPLIQIDFITNSNYWYDKYIHNLIYKDYPFYNNLNLSRAEMPNGIPAIHTLNLVQTNNSFVLDDNIVNTGNVNWSSEFNSFKLYTVYEMYKDYMDLKNKALELDFENNQRLRDLAYLGFKTLIANKYYDFNVRYVLPGLNITTTTRKMSFYYE